MLQQFKAEQVGNYLVTPLIKAMDSGLFAASVSIRRGMYDRIFRFVPSFASSAIAARYAMEHARDMVLRAQLA